MTASAGHERLVPGEFARRIDEVGIGAQRHAGVRRVHRTLSGDRGAREENIPDKIALADPITERSLCVGWQHTRFDDGFAPFAGQECGCR